MNTREFCFWLKGHLDATAGYPNTPQIREMLTHITEEDTDPIVVQFGRELKRLLSPAFGYAGDLPKESLPGIAKALDAVFNGSLPKTIVTATRGRSSWPVIASDAEAYYSK